jgi:hypothetical protein
MTMLSLSVVRKVKKSFKFIFCMDWTDGIRSE